MTDPFEIREPLTMPTATVLQFTGHKRCPDIHAMFNGSLYSCVTCKGAEGDLPAHCPGVRMQETQKKSVMMALADFKNGEWIEL